MSSSSVGTGDSRADATDVGVVILAAGVSSRMGRPKQLLPWNGTSVIGHQLRVWDSLGVGQLAVVLAARDAALALELDRLGLDALSRVVNPDPERGMFSSVQAAAGWPGWRTSLSRVVISLGDQPQLGAATLSAVLEFAARHASNIVQPCHEERPRHPVVVPAGDLATLAEATEGSLREWLAARPGRIRLCGIDDDALDADLDTPEDYARLRAAYDPTCRETGGTG